MVKKNMNTPASKAGAAQRVLVVEDEPDIAALIAYQLTREGYRVETAATGTDALSAVSREIPDLVVLDRMLPGLSGDEVLQSLKGEAATKTIPILVLTAKREQEERIEGFELGADDYLTKPFSPRELVLRVKAILRRIQEPALESGGRILRAGPVSLDVNSHQVLLDGEELNLTPTEFRLLSVLVQNAGKVVPHRVLLTQVWGEEYANEVHYLKLYIRYLRQKIEESPSNPRYILTEWGIGYRFREPEKAN